MTTCEQLLIYVYTLSSDQNVRSLKYKEAYEKESKKDLLSATENFTIKNI